MKLVSQNLKNKNYKNFFIIWILIKYGQNIIDVFYYLSYLQLIIIFKRNIRKFTDQKYRKFEIIFSDDDSRTIQLEY